MKFKAGDLLKSKLDHHIIKVIGTSSFSIHNFNCYRILYPVDGFKTELTAEYVDKDFSKIQDPNEILKEIL